jgi:2-oxoglutarate ferredoxin oxidoreductase subunit alpha/2-oxoisovalerate ferredoxin oxidoreductase alpha subunit
VARLLAGSLQPYRPMSESARERPRPVLAPAYCKGCDRCVEACAHHCIEPGSEILPASGLVPVALHLEKCTGCGLCFDACPEPYALVPEQASAPAPTGPPSPYTVIRPAAGAMPIPDERVPLPACQPLVVKGTHASAIGALLAGCRHFFGYPITPSTEGAELMARVLPHLGGFFVQSVSEVAAVNSLYGCGAAGRRAMTFTSSPGFSLMLEGLSYMIGAEVPGVVVDVMRGGPGLGNIGPEQSDIKLACRGLGHGNTHAIVLAPSTPQEMLDLTYLAFELSMRYRNPVVVLADGYLGQMTGRVTLPPAMVAPGLPAWAVSGDADHRRNLVSSIFLAEADLEAHNLHLVEKYRRMETMEARAETFRVDDADLLIVAGNTPARMVKGAVRELRARGVRAGSFRPITFWPFPIERLRQALRPGVRLLVVEAGDGQLEDELRLALSTAGLPVPPLASLRRYGGMLPGIAEIVPRAIDAVGVAGAVA